MTSKRIKIDILVKKYMDLSERGMFDEANAIHDEIIKLKYDTSRLKGEATADIISKSIFGTTEKYKVKIKPKPNGVGFDLWIDGKKKTIGNIYLPADTFSKALKAVSNRGDYSLDKKITNIKN